MSFPAYPAYQDSGVEWLGALPHGWAVKRVKHVTRSIEQGWSPQCDGFPVASTEEWGVLKVGCVNGGIFDPEENKALPAELTPIPELGISAGDVLISRANTRELVGGAVCVSADHPNLLLCDKLYRLRLNDAVCLPQWLAVYLRSDAARGQIELAASGASHSMVNIGQGTILDLPMPLPTRDEQCQILSFLDRETGKIDALVAEQGRLIALLKEKRQAVISHAVTKGLDASAPMKDSGVAWLGQVPVHWEVVPSTWLFAEGRERAHADDQQLSATQKYGVIPQAEFELLEGRQVTHALMHLDQRKHVEVDNFVISMRSFEGGIERVKSRGCVRSSYIALIGQRKAKPSYFSYVFKSKPYIQGLQTTANFVRDGQDLNYGNFRQVPVPLPPGEEQENIAAFLNFEANRVDALATEAHRAIALLRERRASLISAAVTGKIDVRGLIAAPAAEAA